MFPNRIQLDEQPFVNLNFYTIHGIHAQRRTGWPRATSGQDVTSSDLSRRVTWFCPKRSKTQAKTFGVQPTQPTNPPNPLTPTVPRGLCALAHPPPKPVGVLFSHRPFGSSPCPKLGAPYPGHPTVPTLQSTIHLQPLDDVGHL